MPQTSRADLCLRGAKTLATILLGAVIVYKFLLQDKEERYRVCYLNPKECVVYQELGKDKYGIIKHLRETQILDYQ